MRWPGPFRRRHAGEPGGRESAIGVADPGEHERASPGLAALFGALDPATDHRLLDLGPASGRSLEVYGRFASRVRFADLARHGSAPPADEVAADPAESRVAPLPVDDEDVGYTVVVAWDALGVLGVEARTCLVERIAARCAPGARLYAVAGESELEPPLPARFTLIAPDRVVERPEAGDRSAAAPLSPAEVGRALRPFVVERSFVLRCGVREYVAVLPATVTAR